MKVTYEFDTDSENFNSCEFEQYKSANDMAAALWELQEAIRTWYKYDPSDLTPDALHDTFYDILSKNNINLERLWR